MPQWFYESQSSMSHQPEDLECRGVLLDETSAAIRVQKAEGRPAFWIPRSQISYLKRSVNRNTGVVDLELYVPEWLIDKKDAWDIVV